MCSFFSLSAREKAPVKHGTKTVGTSSRGHKNSTRKKELPPEIIETSAEKPAYSPVQPVVAVKFTRDDSRPLTIAIIYSALRSGRNAVRQRGLVKSTDSITWQMHTTRSAAASSYSERFIQKVMTRHARSGSVRDRKTSSTLVTPALP